MKKSIYMFFTTALAAMLLNFAACAGNQPLVMITPKPSSYVENSGEFTLTDKSRIVVTAGNSNSEVKQNVAEYLAAILRGSTGFRINITDGSENTADGDIVLSLGYLDDVPVESYSIKVETNKIIVTANEPAGLFRAVQTLRQLFGPDIERKSTVQNKKWKVACVEISDSPVYRYRGLMIDVARHFFPKEIIMRQIDLAVQYKINKLHLHLTDDQGWRIEIKSWPALTEIGSLSAVNGDKGGYFTQNDFKEIVKYAAARYVEVIPEIDMPGHVNAALASIPELNPNGRLAVRRTDTEVGHSTFQTRSETTYQFIDDVIRELAEISPSKYIHIGGDEADSTSRVDYYYFIDRVSEIVRKYGKTTIGWEPYERAGGTLEDAVLQYWHNDTGAADQKGMQVILSPAGAYLDQKYNANTKLGLSWRGYVNLQKSYSWSPVIIAPRSKLLGVESALWTETIVTEDDIDHMLYPRLIANAEIGWTAITNRSFIEFKNRLPEQLARLDILGVKYGKNYN